MAADPESIPAGPLRDIAYRVPADCRAMMDGPLELKWRAEWVYELECRALSEAPDKADRTRKLADRIVRSLSDYSFSHASMELSQRLSDAHRRGDSQAAADALSELRSMETKHPRLPPERAVGHVAEVVAKEFDRLTIPPVQKSKVFLRNRLRK